MAEYDGADSGNYKKISRELLIKFKFDNSKVVFEQGQYMFSGTSSPNQLIVIVLSNANASAQTRFYVVDQILNKFQAKYGNAFSGFSENSRSSDFGPDIKRIFDSVANPSQAKLNEINQNLAQTREIMTENLAKALARSEQLEVMEAKAQNISEAANTFQRNSSALKKQMCWQRYRWYLIAVIVAVVVIAIIVIIIVSVTKKKK